MIVVNNKNGLIPKRESPASAELLDSWGQHMENITQTGSTHTSRTARDYFATKQLEGAAEAVSLTC